jgi:hypothetical protein
VDIRTVRPNVKAPRTGRNASTGTFVSVCGNNANGHNNPDNFITSPGVSNGAHHMHDYVGNRTTDGQSTNDSLAAGGTTCRFGDRSAYYWPVLRRTDRKGKDAGADGGGKDGNLGRILRPTDVRVEFRGNVQSKVRPMPNFLRIITGDAKAHVNGPTNARAQWTCTGFDNRVTTSTRSARRAARCSGSWTSRAAGTVRTSTAPTTAPTSSSRARMAVALRGPSPCRSCA